MPNSAKATYLGDTLILAGNLARFVREATLVHVRTAPTGCGDGWQARGSAPRPTGRQRTTGWLWGRVRPAALLAAPGVRRR
jgi:hypothetical protein